MTPVQSPCPCGSGLPFARCHADSRNEFARGQALREAEMIGSLFPAVRVAGADVEAFADRVASSLPDEAPEVEGSVMEEGLALVGRAERRRVVRSWSSHYDAQWRSLSETAGDDEAAERAVVAGALQAAVAERRAIPRAVVELLETAESHRAPLAALATVLPPMFVWSRAEAECGRAAAQRRKARERLEVIEDVGYALLTTPHVRRLRRQSERLAARLPLAGLPAASATLARACADVATDDAAARSVTAGFLVAYVEQVAAAEAVAGL